jgi:uncharacterized protein
VRIVVSGASGLIGRSLVASLESDGHRVDRLVRRQPVAARGELPWSPAEGLLEPAALAGVDVVVNLNGRGIGDARWTPRIKRELTASRLEPTRLLARTLALADPPPALLVNASAVGYYGDRGEAEVDESAPPGAGFLADLTNDWEAAARAAASPRTRVVLLRLGMVLGGGGALASMLPLFRLGLGGRIGSGRQWWPWIGIDDVVGAVRHLIDRPDLEGPFNLVAPEQVRCEDFVAALGRVLGRPAALPVPAFAVRLALGEMASALLLASARVRPAALLASGHEFATPHLEAALRRVLP